MVRLIWLSTSRCEPAVEATASTGDTPEELWQQVM